MEENLITSCIYNKIDFSTKKNIKKNYIIIFIFIQNIKVKYFGETHGDNNVANR